MGMETGDRALAIKLEPNETLQTPETRGLRLSTLDLTRPDSPISIPIPITADPIRSEIDFK